MNLINCKILGKADHNGMIHITDHSVQTNITQTYHFIILKTTYFSLLNIKGNYFIHKISLKQEKSPNIRQIKKYEMRVIYH